MPNRLIRRTAVRKHATHEHHNGHKKSGYGVTSKHAASVKKFNQNAEYVQGFKATLSASGTIPINIALNAPGKFLLGISIVPATGTNADIANSQVTLVVNNNTILLNAASEIANPGFVHCNSFYLPTPQPLSGNDTITVNILNNAATTPVVYVNIHYVPQ